MSPRKLNQPGKKVDNRPVSTPNVTTFETPMVKEPNGYCNSCGCFKDEPFITSIGTWEGYCNKLSMGRNYHSDRCLKAE